MTLHTLAAFYGIADVAFALNEVASAAREHRPPWRHFRNRNKLAFLTGILTHTPDEASKEMYATQFYWTFGSERLPAPNTHEERDCLHLLYSRCIEPFKQYRMNGFSFFISHDEVPPSPATRSVALVSNSTAPTYSNFTLAIELRDQVCLFCWNHQPVYAAQLIGQASSTTLIVPNLLKHAGLDSLNCVQNVSVSRTIHVADGRLIAKVVKRTNDPNDRDYLRATISLANYRGFAMNHQPIAGTAGISAVDTNNELPVIILNNDMSKHPNHTALAFHKAACLIWNMAGGREGDDDDDLYDNGGGVW
ncbi:hypothetical protein BJ741DRAFT_647162 [Chytriomyces cf. hyalinus JEL632]|nr:hypothetical protein BJ741DRAFT_647162 [Chytriomyces cf. hyalinus JEL632]